MMMMGDDGRWWEIQVASLGGSCDETTCVSRDGGSVLCLGGSRPARIRVFRGHGAWWLTAMIIPTKNPVRSWSPTANWQTAPETPRETASLQNHRCRITARWQRKRTTSSAACVRGKKERSSDTKTSVPRRAMVLPAPVEAIATSSRPTKAGLNFRWRFLVSNLSTYYR